MNDLLAVISDGDEERMVERIARRHPRRVTLLLDGPAAVDEDRMARLIASVERETGAVVVGLAGSRAQLEGWRFDGVLEAAAAPAG